MTPATDPDDLLARLFGMAVRDEKPDRFGRMRYVGDPPTAAAILSDTDAFEKDYGGIVLLGHSRLSTNGVEWRRRRAASQPAYSAAARPHHRPRIRALLERELDGVPDGSDHATLSRAIASGTLRVVLDAIAPEGVAAEDVDTLRMLNVISGLRDAIRTIHAGTLCDGSDVPNVALRPAAEDARRAFGEAVRLDPVLSAIVRPLAETLDPDVARDNLATGEVIMNLSAGFDTSSAAMLWTVDRLGSEPERQEALRAEAFGPESEGASAFPSVSRFAAEAMRLMPPIPLVTRITTKETTIGERRFVPGDQVLISIIAAQRDPAAWERPHRFDPDRPAHARGLGRDAPRGAYIPFSIGNRVCGGAGLARVELEEGVAAVLRRWRIRRKRVPPRFRYALALRPVADGTVTIERLEQ